jgi:hypothetical protein
LILPEFQHGLNESKSMIYESGRKNEGYSVPFVSVCVVRGKFFSKTKTAGSGAPEVSGQFGGKKPP